jgi:glycosyltransferase involved in cell wall biosynthesis
MRIAIIHSGVRGIASYCFNLYSYLKKQGHEVLFISESKWVKEKIPMYEAESFMLFGLIPLVYRPEKLIKKIYDFKPDIIHYHWPSGTMDILFNGIKKYPAPKIITLHTSVNSKKFFTDRLWALHFGIFKKNLKYINCINSVSGFIQERLKERIKIPEDKLKLIYTGIDHNLFKPIKRKKINEKDDNINLVFVGQIMPEKGIDVLVKATIKAIKLGKNINLTIIGDGHLKFYLKELSKKYKQIKWAGFINNQNDIVNYYRNSDLSVLLSRWDEAFAMVLLESLACGTPVLATKKGGTPEIIIQNKTGFLIDNLNENKLINILMNLDKKEIKKMRPYCRKIIEQKFNLDSFGKNHEELYLEIIKKYNK